MKNDDLIRRSDALAQFPLPGDERWMIGCVINVGSVRMRLQRVPAVEVVEAVRCDVVPRDEFDALLKRFRHLLESDFIRSFDKYDPRTGTYKRDIHEADEVALMRCEKCEHFITHEELPGSTFCMRLCRPVAPDFYCAFGTRKDDR